MTHLNKNEIKRLKADAKLYATYERPQWWKMTQELLEEQGYSKTAATRRSFNDLCSGY